MLESPSDIPPDDVEALARQTQPTALVYAAAGLGAGTGLFALMTTFQLWAVVRFRGAYELIPLVVGAVGILSWPLAVKIWRLRPWATVTGTILFAFTALGSSFWVLISFGAGLFSLAAALVPLVSLGAAVTTALSITASRRAAAARHRLAQSGLDISL
jgi:hypothetical protein